MKDATKNNHPYLLCERKWVYFLLITVAGFWGAFTYLLRGNVFCNAQTGNVVLMGMAFGSGNWRNGCYYLVPISAYILGAFVSELVPNPLKRRFSVRWDTMLIAIECLAALILGFVPETAPVQISQVIINFVASMQYNTFRQAEGIPMATTFCTNHVRQMGIFFAKAVRHRNWDHVGRLLCHLSMLVLFVLGGVIATVLCRLFLGRALLFTLIPLGILFVDLLRADRKAAQN